MELLKLLANDYRLTHSMWSRCAFIITRINEFTIFQDACLACLAYDYCEYMYSLYISTLITQSMLSPYPGRRGTIHMASETDKSKDLILDGT